MVTLYQFYRITNYTTTKGRNYAAVVPHPTSVRIDHRTHFQLVTNEMHVYYFNFVKLQTLEDRLAKGSPFILCPYSVGRAESIGEMIPTTGKKKNIKTLYLRGVMIMDDMDERLIRQPA
ncbi:hypothetical protein CASFOL_013899 [Castilleja foliolosa]|uniref:Uncharacterized protein n=1 Tax=Castilleja foliolosa TaxID=1961234 RepID=A0ABD3DPY6_9LAMI